MSLNRSLLTAITKDLEKKKKPSKPRIPRNQWQHPGEVTTIPSNQITMEGVSYPVLGVPNVGPAQMMNPDQNYTFPGASNVTEYPMMQIGGIPNSPLAEVNPRYRTTASKLSPKELLAHRQRIYNNIRPSDYWDESNYARYLFNVERDMYDDPRSEEGFKQYLGLNNQPKFIQPAEYRPTIAKNPKTKYYKVDKKLEQDLFNSFHDKLKPNQIMGTDEFQVENNIPYHKSLDDKGLYYEDDNTYHMNDFDQKRRRTKYESRARVLGNFTVSRGKDDKGEYMSYYDKYDFPGLVQSQMQGTPYELYGRVYYPQKADGGQMIRRADGSYSRRGLWDNIRANRGSGKKPTREMLVQERKIRTAEKAYGGDAGYHMMPDGTMMLDSEHMQLGGLTRVLGYVDDLIKNAHKINPWAFKPTKGMMYRGLNKEGYLDALESGVFRSKQNVEPSMIGGLNVAKSFGTNPYFTPKFETAASYGSKYLAEVPESAANWRQRYKRSDWSQVADRAIPITDGRILKQHWLQGYKPVNKDGGSTFSGNVWYQDGGAAAYVDSVLNANKHLNWVKRLYDQKGKSIMLPGQTDPSTHFMESGDGRVYPTVVQMPDGSLQYLGDKAYDYADSTKSYIQFPDDKAAQWFGKNYKKGTNVLKSNKNGGSTYSGGVWYEDGGIPIMQNAGQTPDDDSWISRILDYEATHGSATGRGLGNFGYNAPRGFKKDPVTGLYKDAQGNLYNGTGQYTAPRTRAEAVNQFKKEYLPSVSGYAPGIRERMGDFLFNSGEDARLYQLDQYVRKYENNPDGLADRGTYRAGAVNNAGFGDVYKKYEDKIKALPMEEQIRLMDQGRDYYYQNIQRQNGKPNAAYAATWKPRLGIFGAYKAPAPVAQPKVATPAAVTPQPAAPVQAPIAQPIASQRFNSDTGILNQNQNKSGLNSPYTIKPQTLGTIPSFNLKLKQTDSGDPFGNKYFPSSLPDYSLEQLNQDTPEDPKISFNPAQTQAADDEIQRQADADLAQTAKMVDPVKLKPKPTYNQQVGAVYNKMASNLMDPYSLTNMVRMTGDVIEGINNQRNYNKQLDRQRMDYSTDQAFQAQGTTDTSRGVYDMYNQFIPDRIGGNMSFAGMNPMFEYGGMSDFDNIADMVELPSMPFIPAGRFRSVAPADATRVAPRGYTVPPADNGKEDISSIIARKESNNNYEALPKDKHGRLISSAAGKYQFLWGDHGKEIKRITGVGSKEAFLKSPEAQERYFQHWNQNVLTPVAEQIRQQYNPTMSINQLKQLIHFQGPSGAKKFIRTGKYTTDGFGSNPMTYLAKREQGGEVEMTEKELREFLAMGGQVDFC